MDAIPEATAVIVIAVMFDFRDHLLHGTDLRNVCITLFPEKTYDGPVVMRIDSKIVLYFNDVLGPISKYC